MSFYGYVRVSSTDSNEARQTPVMQEKAIPEKHVYAGK